MPDLLTPTQRTLLDMLAVSLFGARRKTVVEDPVALWREAYAQGVFLMAFRNVRPEGLPPTVLREVHASVKRFMASNVRLSLAHAEISGLLEAAGIPHAIIKGYACSVWYPAPELRQLGDVDFLVAPEDVARAGALLAANGYTPGGKGHSRHELYFKDHVRFEMHFELPGIPEGPAGDACRKAADGLIARSSVRETPFGAMRLPSVCDHGLVILLHLAHHLTNSGVGLRQLCDWAVFADTLTGEEFERLYGETLRLLGLRRFVCCLNDLCARYLGCDAGYTAGETDPALADALLADILSGGNFGQKDADRSRQAYLITSGTGQHSRPKRLLVMLREMVYQKMPLTKKYKVLVPAGFAVCAARYFWRAAHGKRPKLHARAAVRGAAARTELYDRLRLFEGAKEETP